MTEPFIRVALAAFAGVLVHAEQVSGEVKRIYPAGDKVYFQLKMILVLVVDSIIFLR